MKKETKENEEVLEKTAKKRPAKWMLCILLVVIIIASVIFLIKILNPGSAIKTSLDIMSNKITISCEKERIAVGEQINIDINKKDENIIWQSSNPEVISVEDGVITGVAEGKATIYACYNEQKSNELEFECIIELEEIILSKTELELERGKEEQIDVTFLPENATNKELIWKSENEEVATVENGLIKAINIGKTTITVSNTDLTKTVTLAVEVTDVQVTSVALDETSVKLGTGQNYILYGIIKPSNATNQELVWSSSNTGVITVNDGSIKAISTGEATVTITSKNGKTAQCKFYVNGKPNNTVKYATNSFNIRKGPGTSYAQLGSVAKNDEIEILKETQSWAKVRLSNGIVGYTVVKSYSSDRMYFISNVPYINQFQMGYPTGCEAVSATMAAKYSGYNVSVATIVANTPTDELGKRQETRTKEIEVEVVNEETGEIEKQIKTEEETIWVGANPFKYFVGHPTRGLSTGSYGCFAAPIATALRNSGVPCSDISGSSIDTVFNYVKQGKPVVVWCKKNAGDLTQGVTWQYPDGSGEFTELVGEHCAVLIGYDGEYVYLNDPSAGKNVKQPKGKFISNWKKLYSQAIIIN